MSKRLTAFPRTPAYATPARAPNSKNYTDTALEPDSETMAKELEMLVPHAGKQDLVTNR